MIYFIDTNIFLRTLINEDPDVHTDCLAIMKMIKQGSLEAVTGGVVLTEIVWTLSSFYAFPRKDVSRAIESILHLRRLKIIETYKYIVAIKHYQSTSVKFVDALIASIPQLSTREWTVLSYDRDFDKLGVRRKEPHHLITKN